MIWIFVQRRFLRPMLGDVLPCLLSSFMTMPRCIDCERHDFTCQLSDFNSNLELFAFPAARPMRQQHHSTKKHLTQSLQWSLSLIITSTIILPLSSFVHRNERTLQHFDALCTEFVVGRSLPSSSRHALQHGIDITDKASVLVAVRLENPQGLQGSKIQAILKFSRIENVSCQLQVCGEHA